MSSGGCNVDVPAWPTWNPDITDVALEQPFAPGASFQWHTAGMTIQSTVHAVTDRARTVWSGSVAGIDAIHEWTFTETVDGVQVTTEESWTGEPVEANVAAMQAGLDQSLSAWLQHLKAAAEAKD